MPCVSVYTYCEMGSCSSSYCRTSPPRKPPGIQNGASRPLTKSMISLNVSADLAVNVSSGEAGFVKLNILARVHFSFEPPFFETSASTIHPSGTKAESSRQRASLKQVGGMEVFERCVASRVSRSPRSSVSSETYFLAYMLLRPESFFPVDLFPKTELPNALSTAICRARSSRSIFFPPFSFTSRSCSSLISMR